MWLWLDKSVVDLINLFSSGREHNRELIRGLIPRVALIKGRTPGEWIFVWIACRSFMGPGKRPSVWQITKKKKDCSQILDWWRPIVWQIGLLVPVSSLWPFLCWHKRRFARQFEGLKWIGLLGKRGIKEGNTSGKESVWIDRVGVIYVIWFVWGSRKIQKLFGVLFWWNHRKIIKNPGHKIIYFWFRQKFKYEMDK